MAEAEVVQGFHAGWFQRKCFLEDRDGLIPTLLSKQQASHIAPGCAVVGIFLDRALKAVQCLRIAFKGLEDDSQIVVGFGKAGGKRNRLLQRRQGFRIECLLYKKETHVEVSRNAVGGQCDGAPVAG